MLWFWSLPFDRYTKGNIDIYIFINIFLIGMTVMYLYSQDTDIYPLQCLFKKVRQTWPVSTAVYNQKCNFLLISLGQQPLVAIQIQKFQWSFPIYLKTIWFFFSIITICMAMPKTINTAKKKKKLEQILIWQQIC